LGARSFEIRKQLLLARLADVVSRLICSCRSARRGSRSTITDPASCLTTKERRSNETRVVRAELFRPAENRSSSARGGVETIWPTSELRSRGGAVMSRSYLEKKCKHGMAGQVNWHAVQPGLPRYFFLQQLPTACLGRYQPPSRAAFCPACRCPSAHARRERDSAQRCLSPNAGVHAVDRHFFF